MDTDRCLEDYLKKYDGKNGFTTEILYPQPPLGQAGDRFLVQALDACIIDQNGFTSYFVPVVRPEREEDICNGSHLSLFYLYMFVFGRAIERGIINHVYQNVTGVSSVTPKEIFERTEPVFFCDNFRFVKKIIEPAKGFAYSNNAYEMFDDHNVEIGNISRFVHHQSGKWATVFAFGFERLIMHEKHSINIWDCPPFRAILEKDPQIGIVGHDTARRNELLDLLQHGTGRSNSMHYDTTYYFNPPA